jgi:hypothetical protein
LESAGAATARIAISGLDWKVLVEAVSISSPHNADSGLGETP